MLSPERLLEWIDAYLDQRLSEADRVQLNAALVSDAEARRLFWERVGQHAQLVDILAQKQGQRLAEQEVRPARPRKRPRRPVGLVLAILLLISGIGGLLVLWMPEQSSSDPPPQAWLDQLEGEVLVLVGQAEEPGRSGQVIQPGQEIRTGAGSSAVVAFSDTTRLQLDAETTVRLLDNRESNKPDVADKRLFLLRGMVHATVEPGKKNRPLALRTNQADVVAPAARFRSASLMGETRIEMEAGKAVVSGMGDQPPVELHSGNYVVATAEKEKLVPAPMETQPSANEPIAILNEGSGPVLGLAISPDGQTIATAGSTGQIQLWDVSTHQLNRILQSDHRRVLAVAFSPDGLSLASGFLPAQGDRGGSVGIWDPHRGELLHRLPVARETIAVTFTPDSQTVCLASSSKSQRGLLVWDVPASRERLHLGDRTDAVVCLAVSPDGRLLAAGLRDGRVRLWNLQTGRLEMTFYGHKRDVQAVMFRPDGQQLTSGSLDGSIRFWSLASGAEERRLTGPFKEVRCLSYSRDGQVLASGHGGEAILWCAETGKRLSSRKAHQFAIAGIGFAGSDGQTLVTAGWDRTVKLWRLLDGEMLH